MSIPDEVIAFAEARLVARDKKDFALADTLRITIANAGYEVVDVAGGFELIANAGFRARNDSCNNRRRLHR
jgi:cysteinyl-tRNA synthetase